MNKSTNEERREAALEYARAGIRIFPLHGFDMMGICTCGNYDCPSAGKHPMVKDWQEKAGTDTARIDATWRHSKGQYANIGIPTGQANGWTVLDVDPRHGGNESLAALEAEFGKLPETVTADTGGGGTHYVFAYVPDMKNTASFRPGLDIRGDGGLIAAAPSRHASGGVYRWQTGKSPFERKPAPMPSWLISVITEKKQRTDTAQSRTAVVPEGSRKQHLMSVAGSMQRKGMSDTAIKEALYAENKTKCSPPLQEYEVDDVLKSVLRYVKGNDGKAKSTLTDDGNAERFVRMFGENVRYNASTDKWLIWNGTVWEQDGRNRILNMAADCARSVFLESETESDETRRRLLYQFAMRSLNMSRLETMLRRARAMEKISVEQRELDRDPMKLNCLNGVLDLKTGELLPHDPQYMMTRICNIYYDKSCKTPLWNDFIDKITDGNTELRSYLQKALGYALTGDTGEQAVFFLYGTGSNGKSTLLNIVSEIMGTYARSTPAGTFQTRQTETVSNDLARLDGTRLVLSTEMQEDKRLDEAVIKSMTGGDRIVARFLFGEYFEYVPQFKVFLAVNHKPVIRDTTHSIWRRIKLIPFEAVFTGKNVDKNFTKTIMQSESPGVLAWLVEGCLRWQKEGLEMPEILTRATRDYRNEMDSFGNFFDECCEKNSNGIVANKQLRQVYSRWCEDNGYFPLGQSKLSQKLLESGYIKNRGNDNILQWRGFVIRK